jgi:hypothetical protein
MSTVLYQSSEKIWTNEIGFGDSTWRNLIKILYILDCWPIIKCTNKIVFQSAYRSLNQVWSTLKYLKYIIYHSREAGLTLIAFTHYRFEASSWIT